MIDVTERAEDDEREQRVSMELRAAIADASAELALRWKEMRHDHPILRHLNLRVLASVRDAGDDTECTLFRLQYED